MKSIIGVDNPNSFTLKLGGPAAPRFFVGKNTARRSFASSESFEFSFNGTMHNSWKFLFLQIWKINTFNIMIC